MLLKLSGEVFGGEKGIGVDLPEAHKVWVEATSPNVVNKLSGTRIATGKPLKLEFTVE